MRRCRRPYHRSRAGTRLFHRVHLIVSDFASRNCAQSCIGQQYHCTTGLFNIAIKCVTDNGPTQANSNNNELNCALLNCRPAVNKTQDVEVEITINNLDIITLTETWIKDDDHTTPTLLCPNIFYIVSFPRGNRTDGGIALLYKQYIKVTSHNIYRYPSMECKDFKINSSKHNDKLHLVLVYRPRRQECT